MYDATAPKRTGYVAPKITVWGSLSELTAANARNALNDAPLGQPGTLGFGGAS